MLEQGKISGNQLIVMLIVFLVGTSWLVSTGGEAKQDIWLVLILAILWSIFVASMYISLSKDFPSENIIEILPKVLGKTIGKLVGLFYVFYFILLTALIFRNIGDFFSIVLLETPIQVFIITYAVLGAYAVRKGIEVIGRVVGFSLIVVILLTSTATLLSIPFWDLSNFQPVLAQGVKPIIKGWVSTRGFPFEEIVVFWMVFPFLNQQDELRKKFYSGILLGGLIIFIFTVGNYSIFSGLTAYLLYTSYEVMSYLSITGEERLEPLFIMIYMLSAFGKGSICYYASSLGMAQWLGIKDYKIVVLPLGIIIAALSHAVYENVIEQFQFARAIYPIYIFPLSVVIPLGLLFIIKLKRLCQRI